MEGRMTPKCHVRFGERGRETRLARARQVRSAPTPFSPLFLNVALHGMEVALGVKHDHLGRIHGPRAVVRYADDSVVFCETKEDAVQAIDTLCTWLRERGLALATEKTTLTHLTTGFDFLGCRIRHYRAPQTSRSGYKLLSTPSKASVQRLRETLRIAWRQPIGANAAAVVRRLLPLVL